MPNQLKMLAVNRADHLPSVGSMLTKSILIFASWKCYILGMWLNTTSTDPVGRYYIGHEAGPDPGGGHLLKTGTNPYSWPYPTHDVGSWPTRRAIFLKTGRQGRCSVYPHWQIGWSPSQWLISLANLLTLFHVLFCYESVSELLLSIDAVADEPAWKVLVSGEVQVSRRQREDD